MYRFGKVTVHEEGKRQFTTTPAGKTIYKNDEVGLRLIAVLVNQLTIRNTTRSSRCLSEPTLSLSRRISAMASPSFWRRSRRQTRDGSRTSYQNYRRQYVNRGVTTDVVLFYHLTIFFSIM